MENVFMTNRKDFFSCEQKWKEIERGCCLSTWQVRWRTRRSKRKDTWVTQLLIQLSFLTQLQQCLMHEFFFIRVPTHWDLMKIIGLWFACPLDKRRTVNAGRSKGALQTFKRVRRIYLNYSFLILFRFAKKEEEILKMCV